MLFHFLKCDNQTILKEKNNTLNCQSLENIFNSLEKSNLSGRKPLYNFSYNNQTFVLRKFYHGGVFRNLFKDKFFEKKVRAFEEFKVLQFLTQKKLPVVKPLFAMKSNNFPYSQCLATKFLENSNDLVNFDSFSNKLIEKIFKQIELFFDAGLIHSDLNIKNILIKNNEIYLIDFDKAKIANSSLPVKKRIQIYKRLFRSFDKTGKLKVFDNFSFENLPTHIEKAYKSYLKTAFIRSLLWIFNKK
jgi:tRNA A-37 threonylcarbamoyl transferase component Bud32